MIPATNTVLFFTYFYMKFADRPFRPDRLAASAAKSADCFRERCFASFDQVQGGVEEIPVRRLGFPAEFRRREPRVGFEFGGEIEYGAVAEFTGDALDRTVGLRQQRSGGRRPPLNPVTVR